MLDLTQEEMAKEIGVATVTYQLWEKKFGMPNPTNRRRIALAISRLKDQKEKNEGFYNPKQG